MNRTDAPRLWPRPAADHGLSRSERDPWLPPGVVVVEQSIGRHRRPDDALAPAEALELAEGFELVRTGSTR